MAGNDKTVFDTGATVREDVSTVYEGDTTIKESAATVPDGGTTLLDAALSDAATREDEASVENIAIRKGESILDTYTVETDAIEGGMGSVWRVHHKGWNVDLAMKRPQPQCFSTEKSKADFIHECEAWINLGLHPNIVSCYYVREISGTPTIFSEWMDGGSLESAIHKGTLYEGTEAEQKERIFDIAIQFARGLHYAHEAGLIHQDVKPDNLLLTKEGEAKVADFGLAKARAVLTQLEGAPTMNESAGQNPDMDGGKTIVSPSGGYTPAYCSMEQMDGKELTRRTDIYSWAVSVMEMYCASRLWTNGVVAGLHCRGYFEQARIPMQEALKELLEKCLAAEPEDRPHDFAEIEAKLHAIYQTETGHAYPRPKPKATADTADSLNNRALSMLDLGEPDEAKKYFDTALQIVKGHEKAYCNMQHLLWRTGRIVEPPQLKWWTNTRPTEAFPYTRINAPCAAFLNIPQGGLTIKHTDMARAVYEIEAVRFAPEWKQLKASRFSIRQIHVSDDEQTVVVIDDGLLVSIHDLENGCQLYADSPKEPMLPEQIKKEHRLPFARFIDDKTFIYVIQHETDLPITDELVSYAFTKSTFFIKVLRFTDEQWRLENIASASMEGAAGVVNIDLASRKLLISRSFQEYSSEDEDWTPANDYPELLFDGRIGLRFETPDEAASRGGWHLPSTADSCVRLSHNEGGLVANDERGAGRRDVVCPAGAGVSAFCYLEKRDCVTVGFTDGKMGVYCRKTPDDAPWYLCRIANQRETEGMAGRYSRAYEGAVRAFQAGDYATALSAIDECYQLPEFGDPTERNEINEALGKYSSRIGIHDMEICDWIPQNDDWRQKQRSGKLSVEVEDAPQKAVHILENGRRKSSVRKDLFGAVNAFVCPATDWIVTLCRGIYSDSEMRLWESRGNSLACLYHDNKLVSDVCVSPAGQNIFAVTTDGMVLMWQTPFDAYQEIKEAKLQHRVYSMNISGCGRFLFFNAEQRLFVFDLVARKYIESRQMNRNGYSILFNKSSSSFCTWSLANGGQGQAYRIHWRYSFPGFTDWNEDARPYLEMFLALHPDWRDVEFNALITELQNRGFGYIRPEGVRNKLMEMQPKKKSRSGLFGKRI